MNVKLVSTTLWVDDNGNPRSPEELIMFCARVSSNNQESGKTGLIRYCIENKHWSIFEMADMTVEIETSRAISPQILRHKSFQFQEFSQRYAAVTEFEPMELRMQGSTKQGSDDLVPQHLMSLQDKVERSRRMSEEVYKELLQHGVSRESARGILPLCAQTKLYMKGSVRSWIHYLQVRCASNTQKEHRLIAEKIKEIFVEEFPLIADALNWE